MTDEDEARRDERHHDWGLADEDLRDAAERLAGGVHRDTGIRIDPEVAVDGPVAVSTVRGTELSSVSRDSWTRPDPDGGPSPGERLGDLLLEDAAADDLYARLVEVERSHLREAFLDDIAAAVRGTLDGTEPGPTVGVDLDVVELGYDYRHGDPQAVYERGYPSFGLAAWCWDPDVEVVVEFGRRPGDVEELADEVIRRLLAETRGAE